MSRTGFLAFAVVVGVFASGAGVALALDAEAGDEAPGGRTFAPHELLQLRLEHDNLTLYTALPPTPSEEVHALSVPELRATGEATVTRREGAPADGKAKPGPTTGPAAAGGLAVPGFFRLALTSDNVPGQRVSWQIAWTGGALDIQRTSYFTGQYRYTRMVRLLAAPIERARGADADAAGIAGAAPPRHPVQLFVTEAGSPGRELLKKYVHASHFFALLRQHPEAAEEFVRPLMRELGQEAVFAPEPPVAWQVFAAHWTPPERLKEQVTAALPGLDAEPVAEREAASAKLAGLGREGALLLMRLDRRALTAEQNSRIDAVVAAHAPLPRAEAERLREDVPFLLDALNCEDEAVRSAALEQLRAVTRRPIAFDPAQGAPARHAAVAKIREDLGR